MYLIKVLLCLVICNFTLGADAIRLGNYLIRNITVSGISSGGAMAAQTHVALSSIITGSGNIAGPPYYCAQNSLLIGSTWCMSNIYTLGVNMNAMVNKAESYRSQGLIDNLANLKNHKVYIFSGVADIVTSTSVVKKNEEFFRNFMDQSNIRGVYSINAAHGMITDFYGGSCAIANGFFLNDCGYNQAYDILKTLHPNRELIKPTPGADLTGTLAEFDQSEFFQSSSGVLMDSVGYIYIPKECETKTCDLHIAFHGCLQAKYVIGNVYAKNSGYNQVADLNNFIILYPQATASLLNNPSGCWDWWGYTDSLYASKEGKQIKTVKAMIDRLAFNK